MIERVRRGQSARDTTATAKRVGSLVVRLVWVGRVCVCVLRSVHFLCLICGTHTHLCHWVEA